MPVTSLLAVAFAFAWQSSTPTNVPVASLAGTWVSTSTDRTVVVSRTFTIAVDGGRVTVATPRQPGIEATVFVPVFPDAGTGAALLLVRHPPTGALTQWDEIRPVGPDTVTFEVHLERHDGKPSQIYAETFVRKR